mmetsp:Transcript_18793/g.18765  ORF Transcript_18793/g.18765 Transcript_18793/m.18765 type:complete len:86 (+) Transcript_18793:214-471(+)
MSKHLRNDYLHALSIWSCKAKVLYSYIFEIVKIHVQASGYPMQLKSITFDFEKGLIQSIKNIYPEIRIVGCLYHLKRTLERKLNL